MSNKVTSNTVHESTLWKHGWFWDCSIMGLITMLWIFVLSQIVFTCAIMRIIPSYIFLTGIPFFVGGCFVGGIILPIFGYIMENWVIKYGQ